MRQHLYITAAEAGSGKSVVTLGIIQLLVGSGVRLGYFRPVVHRTPDPLCHLIEKKFQLSADRMAIGMDYQSIQNWIGAGRYQEVLEHLLAKFKELENRCDQIICTGSDFSSVPSALEFDFNVDVANNLGCLILPVVCGLNRSPRDIQQAYHHFHTLLRDRGCDIFISLINRVPREHQQTIRSAHHGSAGGEDPVFVLAEEPVLGQPTVRDVMHAMQATLLYGEQDLLNSLISRFIVAAMELPEFLNYVENGCFIITPGDRSDIILGCLASCYSSAFPQIAGLLLCGGLQPAPAVHRLIQGLGQPPVAVLGTAGDTYATAMRIQHVTARLAPEDDRKIAAALSLMDEPALTTAIKKRLTVERSTRVTPLMFEHDIIQKAKQNKQCIVLPESDDIRILKAAEILRLRDVVDIILLGEETAVRKIISNAGLRLDDVVIVDPLTSAWREDYAQTYFELRKHKGMTPEIALDIMADASFFGTMMVYKRQAGGMVSGAMHTTQHTIRPAFQFIKTKAGITIVSSVFFMCLPDRVLVYGDCAVNPNPNAQQLADIAIASANTAATFGIEPLVAMLSYSSGDSGTGEAVDKVRAATDIARHLRPDLKIEGPIQYDAAIDAGVARTKMPGSEVAGRATVFIFPDLNTGNNTYKAVQRSAGAVAVGPVLQGLKKPVNDLSRGCTVPDIVNTVAITAIQAQQADAGA